MVSTFPLKPSPDNCLRAKILQAHMSENVHTWRVYVVQSSSSSLGGNTEMVWLDVGQSLMVCRLDMHALTWYFGERVT